MTIRFYKGYLRNCSQLCGELGLRQSGSRRETELAVLSQAYRRWGHELVHHLNGAFAFAVRDGEAGTLFCARDHFGLQSFYYSVAEGGEFLFGGDIRAITGDPHYRKALDRDALELYMMFGYPVGERTLYEGILKLMPGCTLVWDGRSVRIERYYSLSFRPDHASSEEEWIQKIDRTLADILSEDRSNFDFSGGMSFLSGGVDSSYLLAASGVRGQRAPGSIRDGGCARRPLS